MKEYQIFSISFLRFPAFYVLLVMPSFVATLIQSVSFNTFQSREEGNFYTWNDFISNQDTAIHNYLLLMKVTVTLTSIIFIGYRWGSFRNTGAYGFWLTQGISRKKLYDVSLGIFTLIILSGEVFGVICFFFISGIQASFGVFLRIFLLMAISDLLIVEYLMIMAEFILDPEMLLITLLAICLPIMIFGSYIPKIIEWYAYGELYYGDQLLTALFNIGLATILLYFLGAYLHERADIEL